MTNILRKALLFATSAHTRQIYNGKPYIVHPILVAQIVSLVVPQDKNLIAAAYLHDIIEDCRITRDELVVEFNEDVASLVEEVTKDERKNFPNLTTPRGLLLKTADRMANISNLADLPIEQKNKLFDKYSYCLKYEGTHRENGI